MDEKKAENAMHTNPLVTIVVPVYNGANYMREAIDSALCQTYPYIEIIVVNDGSRDNTRDIALSYGNKIRYFEKENGGVSTALNLAIREMKGDYFSWLSHDDMYYPDKVQVEIDALRESGNMLQAVYSASENLVMPENRIKSNSVRWLNSYGKYVSVGALLPVFGLISGCTLLIPKQYFRERGMFDESLRAVQDYKLWFQMFHDKRLIYVDKPLVKSRVHALQVTNTYDKRLDEENWLYCWMVESVEMKDLQGSGLDLYQFLGAAIAKLYVSRRTASDLALKRLRTLPETPNAEKLRMRFADYLEGYGGNGIYLYCMGKRAISAIVSLRMRGIAIDGVSDIAPHKHGKLIEGLVCIAPAQIPSESLIIITKRYPEDAEKMLCEMGYRHIIAYDDLAQWIIETPVMKDQLQDFAQ